MACQAAGTEAQLCLPTMRIRVCGRLTTTSTSVPATLWGTFQRS